MLTSIGLFIEVSQCVPDLQITFWKTEDPDNKRKTEIRLNSYRPCPEVEGTQRRCQADTESGHVMELWPFSRITAGVGVLNGKHSGALSDTIEFETPEGCK